MTQPQSAFRRAPRPLIGWATALLVIGLVLFVLAVLAAIATGFWLTIGRGQGVPNVTGGIENLGTIIAAIFGAGGLGGWWMQTRSGERREEIRAGQSVPPFPSQQPSAPPPDAFDPRPEVNRQ